MCKYCEIDKDTGCGEILNLAVEDCGVLGTLTIDYVICEQYESPVISLILDKMQISDSMKANVKYCPMCGRKLEEGNC